MWFLLAPLSSVMTNPILYWISYSLWATWGIVSGIRSNNRKKGGPYVIVFAIFLIVFFALSQEYDIFGNVAYSFGGFVLGLGIGAILYLLKPSLNVEVPIRRDRKVKRQDDLESISTPENSKMKSKQDS
jgi:hypothetical protein